MDIVFDTDAALPDLVLEVGRHKGRRLSYLATAAPDYLRWLANPGNDKQGRPYRIDPAVQEAARQILAADTGPLARALMAGREVGLDVPVFVVERLGDLDGLTVHRSLADALARLATEYPLETETAEEAAFHGRQPGTHRTTPDPEDDRILVWEVLPSGHRKVVAHFSGWHWDAEEFGLPQLTLPGDDASLYDIAMRDQ